jgi:hypothetical protein
MTNRTRFLAVAFVALCAARARAGDDEPATDQVKLAVTLSEVTSFPEAYRRVPFELELLYHGPRELYNPYYTLFEPGSYMNFAAWPADKPVWTRDAFVDDYALFYVDRKSAALERQMVSLKPFTWFTAHCIVKSTAQGRAWIEVLSVQTTNTTLDLSDLRHMVRANVLASGGEFDRALLEFGMAKMFNAPPRFVARCHADQGRIALAANQPGRAMTELQAALTALPEDKDVIALLDRASGAISVPSKNQQQVASVPTNVPPPLNLNGGTHPAKTSEPKRADAPKPDADASAIDPIAPTSEPVKAPAPPIAPMPKSEPVVAPKTDAAPAAKPAAKGDATNATKTDPKAPPKAEPKAKGDGEKPAPSGDGEKPAAKPDAKQDAKPDPTPAPKGDDPTPADKPEEKKDGTPAPDAPKPAEEPEGKPGDTPAEKPGDAPAEKPTDPPEEKPEDPPAEKPKPDNGG